MPRLFGALLLVIPAVLPSSCQPKEDRAPRTLVVAQATSVLGLDPAQVTDMESIDVLEQIFEHLVRYKARSMAIEPCLATRWERQADGRTWRFFLRKGIRFHDGTPFDADAVVYSFTRQRGGGRTREGRPRFPYWNSYFRNIVQIVREGSHVVRIVTDRPFAPLLASLAMFPVSIVSPRAFRLAAKDGKVRPVGTGPFMYQSWDRKSGRITLKANKKYWGELPGVDRVVFVRIPSSRQRLRALQTGLVHIVRSLQPHLLHLVRLHPDLRLAEMSANNVAYLVMNTLKPPFHDPRIRWAVNHAIRKEPIIGLVYQGMAKAAIGPLPPIITEFYTPNVRKYGYNVKQARRYIREAGYNAAQRPKFLVMQSPRPYLPRPLLAARMIARDLEAVGMPVEIVPMSFGDLKAALSLGQHHLALHGWIGDNADPDNFLYNLLDSDNAGKGRGLNYANFRNYTFHRRVLAGRESTNKADRIRYYREAQQIVAREAPWVPLAHAKGVIAYRREVRGYQVHPSNVIYLHGVSLK